LSVLAHSKFGRGR